MKTSNIILISIVGSITLLIVSVAMQMRIMGEKNGWQNLAEYESKFIELPDFQHIVINDLGYYLEINHGQKAQVELMYHKASAPPEIESHISGDTLFIDKYTSEKSMIAPKIAAPDGLKTIKIRNSSMRVSDFNAGELLIVADHSNVDFDSNHIGKLQIKGSGESRFTAHSGETDTLDLQLDHSTANFHFSVDKLQGSMHDNASLWIRKALDINFKRDESSRLYHMN